MPLAFPLPFPPHTGRSTAGTGPGLAGPGHQFFVTTTPDGRTYLAVRTGAPPSGGSSPSPDTQIYPSQMATLPLNDTPQQGMPFLSGVTLAPNPLVDAIVQNLTDIANANRALLNAPAGTAASSTVPVSLSDKEAQALLQALQQQPNLSPEQQAQINELITQLSGSTPAAPLPPPTTRRPCWPSARRKPKGREPKQEHQPPLPRPQSSSPRHVRQRCKNALPHKPPSRACYPYCTCYPSSTGYP